MTAGGSAGDGPLGFGPDEEGAQRERRNGGDGQAAQRAREGARDDDAAAQRDRWAHRRAPDLDRRPAAPALGRGTGSARYGWVVGVVLGLLLVYIAFNTLTRNGPGSRGVSIGDQAPPFAAPLAMSDLQGDVNVARRAGSGHAGGAAACSVRGPKVLNLCALYERGPVVLAFFATRGAQCTRELDALERVRAAHPLVGFAAVSIRGDRGEVAALAREHGWRFPVGYDRDGILANLYGVAVCPQVTYVARGGRVRGTTFGELGEPGLSARVSALQAGRRVAK